MCPNNSTKTEQQTAVTAIKDATPEAVATMTAAAPNTRVMIRGAYTHPVDFDVSNVTHCATIDMADLLWTTETKDGFPVIADGTSLQSNMPISGFDESLFVDIVDYILKITYWIWHEHKVDLCIDYYSDGCRLHTMTGDIVGAKTVVDNTWATLSVFPDRTLDGENVVWSIDSLGRDNNALYSSHMITSHMTHKTQAKEWGGIPPTNRRIRVRTIADCVCANNLIVEEWLMRDNAHIAQSLGLDVVELANAQAKADLAMGKNVITMMEEERQRVNNCALAVSPKPVVPEEDPIGFGKAWLTTFWLNRDYSKLAEYYDYRVAAHVTCGQELYGRIEYQEYLERISSQWVNEVSAVSLDHVAVVPYLGDRAIDVAYRWTLTGVHGDTQAPMYLLASTHVRIVNGRIREEWTVFDELGLAKQVETHKIAAEE